MSTAHSTDIVREFFKRWPSLYYACVYVLGPAYLGYMSPRQFLARFFPDTHGEKKLLNLGSGPRTVRSDIVNVDITAYEQVSVVASLDALPFQSNSIDGFICDNVLEHVESPTGVVMEMGRILKPGGVAYISTPFLYPYHSSPSDFTRWTLPGLQALFGKFTIIESGTRSGYFSSLTVLLCYGLPTLLSFGSTRVYWLLVNVSLLIFFPIKFLDVFTNRLPMASHTASVFYLVIQKPHA